MSYVIRPITNDDLPKILKIDNAIFPGQESWSFETLKTYCDLKYSLLSYDDSTGDICGYIFLRKERSNCFLIGNLGVDKKFRRQGIGKSLANKALEHVRSEFNEYEDVRFTLLVKNDNPARNAYIKYGFNISHVSGKYTHMYSVVKGLQPAVVSSNEIQVPIIEELNCQESKLKSIEAIVDTLISNIENKEHGRLFSGIDSDKVTQFKELKKQFAKDPRELNPEQMINDINKLCQIKRNPFHFWSTPHSVDEFSQLLKSHNIQPIDDLKNKMGLNLTV